jgi:putative multicomponent Na+:H+ antiporter subunit B
MAVTVVEALQIGDELGILLPVAVLLPVMASLMVCQRDPVQALVLRGMFGAVASLLYALLGAPDVALTEALVGSLLSTTLYAVTLRSSMALRIERTDSTSLPLERLQALQQWLEPLHVRLELLEPSRTPRPAESVHGQLRGGRLLLLRDADLVQRLLDLERARRWQALGGSLDVLEGEAVR